MMLSNLALVAAYALTLLAVQASPVHPDGPSRHSTSVSASKGMRGRRPSPLRLPETSRIMNQQAAIFQEGLRTRMAGLFHSSSQGVRIRGETSSPSVRSPISSGSRLTGLLNAYRERFGTEAAHIIQQAIASPGASASSDSPRRDVGTKRAQHSLPEGRAHDERQQRNQKRPREIERSSSERREHFTHNLFESQSTQSTAETTSPLKTKKGTPTLGRARYRSVPGGHKEPESHHIHATPSDAIHHHTSRVNLDLSLGTSAFPTMASPTFSSSSSEQEPGVDATHRPQVLPSSRKSFRPA